ncbi:hypothetical protein QYF36_016299 [Acer negundo]|nr:hypothetical protein QYF36_016299 [Acer negundo]
MVEFKCIKVSYFALHCIAREILAIPVPTIASQSTFSIGGRFVDPHHSRLHLKTLEALMCAQDWLWSEFKANLELLHLMMMMFMLMLMMMMMIIVKESTIL